MSDLGQSPADAVPDKPAPDRAAWPDLDADKTGQPAKKAVDQPEWPDSEQRKPAADYAWPGQDEPSGADGTERGVPAPWPARTAADPEPTAKSDSEPTPESEPEPAPAAKSADPEPAPKVKGIESVLAPEVESVDPEPASEPTAETEPEATPDAPEPDDEPTADADHEPAPEPEPEPEPVAETTPEPEPEPESQEPEPEPESVAEATPEPEPVGEVEEPDEPTATFPIDEPDEPTAAVPVDTAEPEQRTDAFPIKEPDESTESFPVKRPQQRTEPLPLAEAEQRTEPPQVEQPEQRTESFPIDQRPGQRTDLFSPHQPEQQAESIPVEQPGQRAVQQPEQQIGSFPVEQSGQRTLQQPERRTDSFPVEQSGQRTESLPVEQPGERTETFRPQRPEQRTAPFPVDQPGQRTETFPVKPPPPTARMAPIVDNTTTQFLPRIDPIAPPPPPPPPPRPVQRIESTQVIPVYRATPTPAETTQHIPLPAETTQHIPATHYPDHYDDVDYDDTGEQAPVTDDEPPRRRNRKKKRAILVSAGAVIVVIAVGVAVVLTQPKLAAKLGLRTIAAGPTTQAPPSPVVYSAQLKPAGGTAPTPSTSGISQTLASSAANPALGGGLAGTVLDAATGQVLWDHGSTTQVAPASTNKLLTCAAALLTFPPQTTLDTQVVAGAQPGTIILVGGGDPTLNSLAAPQQTVYPGSARISDLAAQVKAHDPGQVSRILVDVSKFTGPTSAPGWDPPSPSQNNWAPIQPVMLDGGRIIPTKTDTPRTYSPALVAGQALATQLGVSPSLVSLTTTPTPAGATQLGLVHSVTVPDLVANMLQISDNVLAEVMGRMVAIADHQEPSFTGATAAVLDTLRRNGFDTTGVSLSDDSGLSPSDRLTPRLLAQVLRVAASADTSDPRVAKLRPLLLGLPIAGSPVGDGTLAGRYQTAPSSAGKGWVRAKTGTLGAQGVYALAGVVLDADGRLLVFALVTNGAPSPLAPTVLDAMAATLRGCGCR